MTTLYTAKAKTQGGRSGRAETLDGKLTFELSMPGAPTKKEGVTTNPEELFACGYSACFGSAIDYVAGLQKINAADATVEADVSLNRDESGFSLGVTLNVTLPHLSAEEALSLVTTAHQVCPYSKATRGNVAVFLIANGQQI
ncbi:MAG: organic hydroperoxide resistance protein [Alphaproteobacteria bacterium]|nr:organic hydroperoxide resistance protein [Alphaproteobacteria bacterium]